MLVISEMPRSNHNGFAGQIDKPKETKCFYINYQLYAGHRQLISQKTNYFHTRKISILRFPPPFWVNDLLGESQICLPQIDLTCFHTYNEKYVH